MLTYLPLFIRTWMWRLRFAIVGAAFGGVLGPAVRRFFYGTKIGGIFTAPPETLYEQFWCIAFFIYICPIGGDVFVASTVEQMLLGAFWGVVVGLMLQLANLLRIKRTDSM